MLTSSFQLDQEQLPLEHVNDGLGEGTPPTPGKKEARGRKRRSDEPVSKVRVVISIASHYHHQY